MPTVLGSGQAPFGFNPSGAFQTPALNQQNVALRDFASGGGQGNFLFGAGGRSAQGQDPLEELRRQRELMLQRNQQQGQFFDTDPQAQALQGFFGEQPFQSLMSLLQGRAQGTDAPFTQDVINAQLGREQDAAAGQVSGQSDLIRRRFANTGLGGSGAELSALSNVRRRSGQSIRAASRDINSRASLSNFQARERAQGQLQSNLFGQQSALQNLVAQRAASSQQATQNELGIRGQSRVIQG